MEENRRRIEASMARKRNIPALANATSVTEAPPSPSSGATGAMDSLLEKLRAAAPQARDQRDRRRRARLKDRHQVRIASGQKIPDIPDLTQGDADIADTALLSPNGTSGEAIPTIPENEVPETEDVADRAANMLQGLRGDGDGDEHNSRDGSLRVRRRRESSNDERKDRRRRRTAASSSSSTADHEPRSSSSATEPGTTIEESAGNACHSRSESGNGIDGAEGDLPDNPSTPTTIVSPPSPYGTETKPFEIPD